jgi:CRISPR/Cas system CSM-associated protein Csm3 (group 7 of RAMP superfamily)
MMSNASTEPFIDPSSLKRGDLVNRFTIRGRLLCKAPLHVGSGEEKVRQVDQATGERRYLPEADGSATDILVETDCRGRPVIPGSALRGVLKAGMTANNWASKPTIDILFGSLGDDVGESGKLDFFDATYSNCPTKSLHAGHPPYWSALRGTYVVTSVAIDRKTGVGSDGLLYNIEVVPEGAVFDVEIVGHNLPDADLGLLLGALEMAFGGEHAAVTLGAHAGRGFGRLRWELGYVGIRGVRVGHTGVGQEARRNEWKQVLRGNTADTDITDRAGDLINPITSLHQPSTILRFPYTMTLASDLVIRAVGGTGWRLETNERRGPVAVAAPGEASNGQQIMPLMWHVVLDNGEPRGTPKLEFQIPGSSIRGSLRGYLEATLNENSEASDMLSAVFGTTADRGRIEFSNARIVSSPSVTAAFQADGVSLSEPLKAMMQLMNIRVKQRGPVDRITGGAKSGGLHQFMSVQRGAILKGEVVLRGQDGDTSGFGLQVLAVWQRLLENDMLAIGGVGAEGDGRLRLEWQDHVGDELPDCTKHLSAAEMLPLTASPPGPETGHASVQVHGPIGATVQPDSALREEYFMNPYDFIPFPQQGSAYIPPFIRTADEWIRAASGDANDLWSGTITVRLTALQPVHVMGTKTDHGAHKFHRNSEGPAIPAATLRGMIRSYVEARWNCWISTYSRNALSHEALHQRAAAIHAMAEDAWPREFKALRKENPYGRIYGGATDKDIKKKMQTIGRYVGFNSDSAWRDWSENTATFKPSIGPAIPAQFHPSTDLNGRIDLASFLFGAVARKSDGPKPVQVARRGRVRFSDCRLSDEQLRHHGIPALATDDPEQGEDGAYLGGPKPSKSSMFYFRYGTVKERRIWRLRIAQFLAGAFRGRKFYFHQSASACLKSYGVFGARSGPGLNPNPWAAGRSRAEVREQMLESIKQGEGSTFQIYFERLPQHMLSLLMEAISPAAGKIRHKVGYAKPFGFGSVDTTIEKITLRRVRWSREEGTGLVLESADLGAAEMASLHGSEWSWACDATADGEADRWLRYVLTYPDSLSAPGATDTSSPRFAYPGYKQRKKITDPARVLPEPPPTVSGFVQPNLLNEMNLRLPGAADVDYSHAFWKRGIVREKVYPRNREIVVERDYRKRTLDLGMYQRRSAYFDRVCKSAALPGEDLATLIHRDSMTDANGRRVVTPAPAIPFDTTGTD